MTNGLKSSWEGSYFKGAASLLGALSLTTRPSPRCCFSTFPKAPSQTKPSPKEHTTQQHCPSHAPGHTHGHAVPGALPGEPRGPARRSHACTCGNRGAEHPERTASPSRNTAQEAPPPRQPPRAGGADTHRTHTAARTALCPQPAPSRPQGTLHTHTHRRRTAARPGNCSGLPRRGRSRTLAGGRTSGNVATRGHKIPRDCTALL